MHGAVLNSLALKKYGISASTPTPAGGVIVRTSQAARSPGAL
jgi:predicted amidohydrolase YtcJ